MFGDLILEIKRIIKQFFCIHDYKIHYVHQVGRSYKKCTKCDKIK